MAFKLLLFLFVIIKLVLSDLVDECLLNALDLDLQGNECDDMTEWAWDTTSDPISDYLTDIETKFKNNPQHTKFVCQCIAQNDNTFENLKINNNKLYLDCYDPMIKSCKTWCEHEMYELYSHPEDDEATKINKCNDFKTNYTQCNFKRNRLYPRVQTQCNFTNDAIPSTELPTISPTITPTLSPTIPNIITSTEAVTNDTNTNDNDGNGLIWTPDPSQTPSSTPTTSPTETPTASPSIAPTIESINTTVSPTILMKNTSDSNAVISVNASTTTSTTLSTSTTANTTFETSDIETSQPFIPSEIINDTESDNENIIIPETTDESAYIPQNPGGNLMMVVIVIIGFCIFVTWFANKAKKSDEFSNSHERVSMKDEDNTTFNYNDDDDIESMNMKMRGQYKQSPNGTSLNGTKKAKKRKVKKKSGGKFTEIGTDDEDSGGDLNISSEEFGFSDDDDNNNTHTGGNNIMPNNNNNIDSSNNKSHIKSHKTPKSNKSGKKNKIKKKKDKRQEIFTIVDGEDGNDSDWNFSESDDASNTDIHVNAHGNKIRGKMPLPYSSKKIKNKSNNIELSNKIKPMKLKSNNNDNIKPKKNNNISIDISRNWNIDSISPTSDDDNNNDNNNNDTNNNDNNTESVLADELAKITKTNQD